MAGPSGQRCPRTSRWVLLSHVRTGQSNSYLDVAYTYISTAPTARGEKPGADRAGPVYLAASHAEGAYEAEESSSASQKGTRRTASLPAWAMRSAHCPLRPGHCPLRQRIVRMPHHLAAVSHNERENGPSATPTSTTRRRTGWGYTWSRTCYSEPRGIDAHQRAHTHRR